MSRTTLCLATAAVLAACAFGIMLVRRHVLGDAVKLPTESGAWKVTLVVNGKCDGDVRLLTTTPLDFGKQHIIRENCKSTELQAKPVDARHPARRQIVWVPNTGAPAGNFRAYYEFFCTTGMAHPTAAMQEQAGALYAQPKPGQYLQSEPGVETDDPEITALAHRLTMGKENPQDQVEALFHHVAQEVANEPRVSGAAESARDCLRTDSGDARAKSRLLAALCRNRGIPARIMTGLTLARGQEQSGHYWVEVWLRHHWMPMCSFYQFYGKVPRTFLVFGVGDLNPVRGRNLADLDYRFLVEKLAPEGADQGPEPSLARRVLTFCSFHALPPAEQRLVEFLLLLPIAALIVCVFRNLIGMGSFGTFAPALLGLCFRELHSLPGILVFVSIVLTGWLMRRVLDRYHLLQVPRMALMLSLVVIVLIAAIVLAAYQGLPATRYVALFPIVILVGMIERFWTLETEDGTVSSFRTLLATMLIAVTISLVLSLRAVVAHMFRYPETIGAIMAVQLLIGRYTGYRLTELYRFRDFLLETPDGHPDEPVAGMVAGKVRISGSSRFPGAR